MAKSIGIYGIKCEANSTWYVGSSCDIRVRWTRHVRDLKANHHHNTHMQRCWNKYGDSCFSFHVIELCELCDLTKRELYWMSRFSPSFNQETPNEDITHFTHSLETRAKISQAVRGREIAPETGAKIAASNTGKKHTDETKAKMSLSRKGQRNSLGRVQSDETRAKISDSVKRHWLMLKGQVKTVTPE